MPALRALAVASALVTLAACGADEGETSGGESTGGPATTSAPGATSTAPVETSTTVERGAPPPGTVEVVDFAFEPREVVVARGQTVTWVNEDPYLHWIVSTEPDVLDSGEMSQAQTYSKAFPQAGSYTYYCNIHNYMKASVTVR